MDYFGYSIIGVVHLVLVVWALVDLFTSSRTGCAVLLWLIFIIIAPWFGPICYILFGKSRN